MNRNQEVSDCCQSCVSEDRSWILHNIRHRGIFRRLCTSCVLKFYSGSYCCVCYQVFDLSSLPNDRVFCLKCPSISHLNCVDKKDLYLCPPCANPAFQFFNTDKIKISSNNSKNHDEEVVVSENQGRRRIDGDLAKVLVAAAEIAAVSMSKAATATKMEAESRAKDAALARKRAKESVEFLKCATVSAKGKSCKEKDKEKVDSVKSSSLKEKHKKKCKTGGGVEAAGTVEKHGLSRVQFDAERNCKLGESKDLSDIFYSADKEREGSSGVIKPNAVNNVCGKNGERLQLRKCVAMSGNTPSLIINSESHIVKEKNENNGVHSGLPDAEHPQHPPKSNHGVN